MSPGAADSHAAEELNIAPQALVEDAVCLPEIWVRTDAAHVAAFQRETGGEPVLGLVPLTYPFCWLTLPAVRPTLARMIGGDSFIPIHEAQSFDYEQPLRTDADYRIVFKVRRKAEPAQLIVNATISTSQREICARFETVLRIVSVAALAGS
jgi:hypothetical protein